MSSDTAEEGTVVDTLQQANLKLCERFYDAIFGGDWEFIAASVTDDFVVIEAAGLPYGGEWKGVAGFQNLFTTMVTQHFDHLDIRIKGITANDDIGMAHFSLKGTARPTGRPVEVEVAEVTTIRDGKIAQLKPFYFDTKAISEAFAP
jgi:ketosteroid isomerase-like protein